MSFAVYRANAPAPAPIFSGVRSAAAEPVRFAQQSDSFRRDALQIPASWPQVLKDLFASPRTDLQLDAFKVPIDHATPLTPIDKGTRMALFKTRLGGLPFDWTFAHRIGVKLAGGEKLPDPEAPSGAVHALTIVKDRDGQEYVHFVVEKRPPVGGAPVLQLPAGVMDKPGISLLELGMAEVHEETPFRPVDARVLSSAPIPSSAGALSEQKAFTVVRAVYDAEKADKDYREDAEIFLSEKGRNMPLADFMDREKFQGWIRRWEAEGLKIGLDVFAGRSYLF